ncbi:rCG22672 [Rattus norvegicus]|uniref:RCG22672 n=1 Tax=Rattus norvegicus TaxID=10116 RepID=A6KNI7_RAT|nr:rCG22672 [Rattus norvegicus]
MTLETGFPGKSQKPKSWGPISSHSGLWEV